MVNIKDFTFSILQRDDAVPEHEDLSLPDSENTCSRYAQITEDTGFQIRVVCSPMLMIVPYQALLIELFVDGQAINGKSFPRQAFVSGQSTTLTIQGSQKSANRKTLVQKFRFEESDTRRLQDDETLEEARETFKDQGTIKIVVSRASGITTANGADSPETARMRYPKDIIKEKGSTTCVTYENEEKTRHFDTFETTLAEPITTVIYKYRTIEILRDLGVVKLATSNVGIDEAIVIQDDDEESDAEIVTVE